MPDPTTEKLQEVLNEVKKPDGFPGEFTLGNGTVVKAASWEEAFQKVSEMQVNTQAALRDREEQIRQRDAAASNPPIVESKPSTDGFDQKHYWELMNSDPLAADNYKDAFKFGVKPEQVPALYKEVFNASQYSADNFEINAFMQANPDYPGTQEATDYIMGTLAKENRTLTKDNMEYIYLRGVRDGAIEPLGLNEAPVWTPPSLSSGGGTRQEQNILADIANLPDNKLDEYYRKAGLLK